MLDNKDTSPVKSGEMLRVFKGMDQSLNLLGRVVEKLHIVSRPVRVSLPREEQCCEQEMCKGYDSMSVEGTANRIAALVEEMEASLAGMDDGLETRGDCQKLPQ